MIGCDYKESDAKNNKKLIAAHIITSNKTNQVWNTPNAKNKLIWTLRNIWLKCIYNVCLQLKLDRKIL